MTTVQKTPIAQDDALVIDLPRIRLLCARRRNGAVFRRVLSSQQPKSLAV